MSETNEITLVENNSMEEAPKTYDMGSFTSFVPLLVMLAIFYFLLIRPQEKKRKSQENLVSSVKNGERVVTNSGIYGRVTKVNENDHTVDLEIANNVEIKVMKSAISTILDRKSAATTEKTESKGKAPKKLTKKISKKKAK
jgi:preprotein translocase subunit YajC